MDRYKHRKMNEWTTSSATGFCIIPLLITVVSVVITSAMVRFFFLFFVKNLMKLQAMELAKLDPDYCFHFTRQ